MKHFQLPLALVIGSLAGAMAIASIGCSGSEKAADSEDARPATSESMESPASDTATDRDVHNPSAAGSNATNSGDFMSDAWITSRIKAQLLGDELSSGFEVSVESVDGWVTLSGSLVDREAVEHVRNLVEDVEGVRGVDISSLSAVARI